MTRKHNKRDLRLLELLKALQLALQHIATNTQQHTATHCSTLQNTLQHATMKESNQQDLSVGQKRGVGTLQQTLQHTATNILRQHTAKHCNIPQQGNPTKEI